MMRLFSRMRPALLLALALLPVVLACAGGGGKPGGPAPGGSSEAEAGCEAAMKVLGQRFQQAPQRQIEGRTCIVRSQGDLRGSQGAVDDLHKAFEGWQSVDGMAADGMDGTMFGRRKGDVVCRIEVYWDVVDMETFETRNHRATVTCGPASELGAPP